MKHIVILQQPYFNMVLNGTKTIESRFAVNKIAPFEKVQIGDELLIKETGKAVTAKAIVKAVKYYILTPELVEELRVKYGKAIGTDLPADWVNTKTKRYGTLIWVENVHQVDPINVPRSNGAGWICIND